jgi:tRNA pseudouridine38-40 synthase
MPTFRIQLAYDGTEFAGSQIQLGQRTVQGELERVLSSFSDGHVRATLAGRTDRGVHAVGQVAAANLPLWRSTPESLQRGLAAALPHDLAATEVWVCDPRFHPRFDAKWREYRYRIAFETSDPFVSRYAWSLRTPLAVDVTETAARQLCGTHDFATFAGGGQGVPAPCQPDWRRGTRRTIFRCECREVTVTTVASVGAPTRLFELRIVADGFLPRMVRNIVGALVEIGQGRRGIDWINQLVAARDRRVGPPPAPARGLTLWRVGFDDDAIEDWHLP